MDAHSRTSTPRVKKSKHCNWLEELDKTVERLEPGSNWLKNEELLYQRCRLFIMTRYPRLMRPFPDEVIDQEVSHWEGQISEGPTTRCVMDGLHSYQRKQLAALLWDTLDALQFYEAQRRQAKRVHKLALEEPRRLRTLNKKIEKARASLQELREYASPLDPFLFMRNVSKLVEACLERLAVPVTRQGAPEFFKSIRAEYPVLEDPAQLGMVQLYWFFQYGCGLEGRKAEVRVGLIRNAFWKELGVSEVPVRHAYETGESRGCDAVHTAVLRFREGTFLPINR
jgi:hypothetical protein